MDNNTIISYAQYNEDLILSALLHDIDQGFYIDIGASHPKEDSVTKSFYDHGWRGINVEPIPDLYKQLINDRPEDINLNCGIGTNDSKKEFREYLNISGHSTFDNIIKKEHGESYDFIDYLVPIKTLNEILQKYTHNRLIDFIKIDVEGYEYEVIASNDWSIFRPTIICVEANHITHNWKPILKKNGYKIFIFDGLNEFYITNEAWQHVTNGFAERIVNISQHSLKDHQRKAWQQSIAELELVKARVLTLETDILNKDEELINLKNRINYTEKLSLYELPLRQRIYRSLYGTTVDWIRYKKDHTK